MAEPKLEKAYTPGMKRRGVVKVLKDALHDAQSDRLHDRVIGIFGVIIREDKQASVISALTIDELAVVLKAVPEGLHRVTVAFKRNDPKPEVGS